VLTGDKRETAINISNSCKHFSNEMEKLHATDLESEEQIRAAFKQHNKRIETSSSSKTFAYIIDGKTLGRVFRFKLADIFCKICMKCDAVLCCRMSPAQKAMVCCKLF
jgi:phospholipid-translocating ATPase